jgi:hypothetical protein
MIQNNSIYSKGGLLQLEAIGKENEMLNDNNNITFFRYVIKAKPLFLLNEFYKQNIKLNWNDTYVFNIDKNIHLLSNIVLKIKIPYFQFSSKEIITNKTTTSNDIFTKILYDSYSTYLMSTKDASGNYSYYLIPEFILFNNISKYGFTKYKFKEIKKYFKSSLDGTLNDNTIINLLNFNNIEYINNIIPLLLTFGNLIDQYYLNIIENENKTQLKQNLLLPNSYDNYMMKYIKDILFTNYQELYSFDGNGINYNFLHIELENYFENYLLGNSVDINTDIYKGIQYYNNNNIYTDENKYIVDLILKNNLFIHYFLSNIYSSNDLVYPFYKKFNILDGIVKKLEIELNNSFISIPTDNDNNLLDGNGNIITDDEANQLNRVIEYYPIYILNNTSLINIYGYFPFDTTQSIKTLNNEEVSYYVNGNIHFLEIINPENTSITSDNKIIVEINESNSTNNDINTTINISDYNNISNWSNNLLVNLSNLNNNTELENPLFIDFKNEYFKNEGFIKNTFNNFPKEQTELIDLWISLVTLKRKFNNTINNYSYTDFSDYLIEKEDVKNIYKNIININMYPQNIENIYLVSLINFFKEVSNEYFIDNNFIKIFINKFFDYFYYSDKLNDKVTDTNLKGLLFYYNFNRNTNMNFKYIYDSFIELFNMKSFIGYLNITNNDFKTFKQNIFNYKKLNVDSLILNTTEVQTDENSYNLNNTNYMKNLNLESYYKFKNTKYKISNSQIIIDKELMNYHYYKDTLTTFKLLVYSKQSYKNTFELSNISNNLDKFTYIQIKNYKMDDDNIILNIANTNDIILIKDEIFLIENINFVAPLIKLEDNSIEDIGIKSTTLYTILFDNYHNKFTNYNLININYTFDSGDTVYMNYYVGSIKTVYKVTLNENNDKSFSINGDIPSNYEIYDKIEINIIKLPIKKIDFISSDYQLSEPYIVINKSISQYTDNEDLYSTLNTFRITTLDGSSTEIYCRIYEISSTEITFIILEDSNINLLSSFTLSIFNNNYLPNLIENSFLTKNTIPTFSNINLQKPMILLFNSDYDIPLVILYNLPSTDNNSNILSSEYSFENNIITNLSNLQSNQILRDKNGLLSEDNLYSTSFDRSNLNVSKSDIIKTMKDIFKNNFYDNKINGKIIKLIDEINSYFNDSLTQILDNNITYTYYGITSNKVFEKCNELNIFTSLSNYNNFNLDLCNYQLYDFDGYSLLASPLLLDYTDINNIKHELSRKLLYSLQNKSLTFTILNTPWLHFNTFNKFSNNSNQYLINVNKFMINQYNFIQNNLDINNLFNAVNFDQEIISQNNIESNYLKLIKDITDVKIKLKNTNYFTNYLMNTSSDSIYSELYYNNIKLNVTAIDSDIITDYNNILVKYKDNIIHETTNERTFSHSLNNKYYNIIGYLGNITNSEIDLELSDNYKNNNYFIHNNKFYKKSGLSIDDGLYLINSFSIDSSENVVINKMMNKKYYFKIKLDNSISLTINNIYSIIIDDKLVVLRYYQDTDYYIEIYSKYKLKLDKNISFSYINSSTFTNEQVFNQIEIETFNFINSENIIITNVNIDEYKEFNTYILLNNIDTTKNILLKDSEILPNFYNDYNIIYDASGSSYDYVLLNINDSIVYDSNVQKILELNYFSTYNEPPVEISNNTITVHNVLDKYDDIFYKKNWLYLLDTDTKTNIEIDNTNNNFLDSLTDASKNYLLSYCPNNIQPEIKVNNDTFVDYLEVTKDIVYDIYKHLFVISESYDSLSELVKFCNNYRSSVHSNNNIYNIKSVIEDNNNTNILIEGDEYIDKYFIINDPSGNILRPVTLINTQSNYTFSLTDLSDSSIDNMIIYSTGVTTEQFLCRITFNSSHSSDNLKISSNNNNIRISNSSTLVWYFYISNLNTLDTADDNIHLNETKIIINVNNDNEQNEEIIIRVVISDTYPGIELLKNGNNIIEPLYVSLDDSEDITTTDNRDFEYYNNNYFTLTSTNVLNSKTTTEQTINSISIYHNNILNFNELFTKMFDIGSLTNTTYNIDIAYNNSNYDYKKNIGSILKNWEYLDNFDITGKYIYTSSNNNIELIKKYKYYIFIDKNGKLYFNEIDKSYNNILKLKYDNKITNGDCYIYPYSKIFIPLEFTFRIDEDKIHIYTNIEKLSRNEIIEFNNNILRVLYYSNNMKAYVCEIINTNRNTINYSNKQNGYYSFGILNNYLERLEYLKNHNFDTNYYLDSSKNLIHGDYYIESDGSNNSLAIYDGSNCNTNNIFKHISGSYIYGYHLYNSGNRYIYYDTTKIKLKEDMTIIIVNGDNKYTVVIDSILNNRISLKTNTIPSSFNTNTRIKIYIPIQEYTLIDLSGNNLLTNNIDGWLETYDSSGNNLFYKITDSSISESIDNGTYKVFNFNSIDLNYDFNNYIDLIQDYSGNTDLTSNEFIPIRIYSTILQDASNNYYFETNINNIKYCYNQKLLINKFLVSVERIDENNTFYIKNDDFNLIYNSETIYEIIFSSFNINKEIITINDYNVTNNYYFDIPNIESGKHLLNIIHLTEYTDNTSNTIKNIYNQVIKNVNINIDTSNNFVLDSTDYNYIIKQDYWSRTDITRNIFLDNYINVNIDASNNVTKTFEVDSIFCKFNTTKTHLFCEEKYLNEKFLYFIDISTTNYNLMKLSNTNIFQDINQSEFYMNKLVPIRVTKNNFIQLLEPEIIRNKQINNTKKEHISIRVYLKIDFVGIPFKENNKWKYEINTTSEIYNLVKNRKLYFTDHYENKISMTTSNGDYYLESNMYINKNISSVFFIVDNIINEISFNTSELKTEFSEIDNDFLNNRIFRYESNNNYKIQNIFSVTNDFNQNNIIFKGNNNSENTVIQDKSSIIDFNIINESFFINRFTKIPKIFRNNLDFTITEYNNEIYKTDIINKYNLYKKLDASSNIIGYNGNIYNIDDNIELFNVDEKFKQLDIYYHINHKSLYYIPNFELSTSYISMMELLKSYGIDYKLLFNNNKPWELWSELSNNHIIDTNTVSNGIVYVDGTIYYSSSINMGTIVLEDSLFKTSEITNFKNLIDSFYSVNSSNVESEYNKFIELREIENYLFNTIKNYLNQEFFWNNIDIFIKDLVENYNTTNNYNSWTFHKGCIMTNNSNILEFKDGSGYILFNDGDIIERKYYLSSEYNITYDASGLLGSLVGETLFTLQRDNTTFSSEISNFINNNTPTIYGLQFDKFVIFLKELRDQKFKLEVNKYNNYKNYLFGNCSSNNYKNKYGYFYPLSTFKQESTDITLQFTEFPNINFYMPKNNMNIAKYEEPSNIINMINYNVLTKNSKYIYYVYGTSSHGDTNGKIGYYYPLSLYKLNDNDHIHTFDEYPNITFYMPYKNYTHHSQFKPPISLKLLEYKKTKRPENNLNNITNGVKQSYKL